MRISTNVSTQVAQRYLRTHSEELSNKDSRLSSGNQIVRSADNPAGLAISETMKSKMRSNYQAERNTNDSISLLQVAEGSLGVMTGMAGRLRELAIQAANDTLTDSDRLVIDKEFQSLKNEVQRLTASTSFNGRNIIDGKGSVYDLHIGINNEGANDKIRYDMSKVMDSRNNFGISLINLRSKESSQESIGKIDNMLGQLSSSRAELGSMSVRMNSVIQNLQVSRENVASSNSKIRDTDVAITSAERAKEQLLQSASLDMIKTTNNVPAHILKLL